MLFFLNLPCRKHASLLNFQTDSYIFSILQLLELDRRTGVDSVSPPLAAALTGLTFYGPSGIRVAGLGGAIGMGAVGATYAGYTVLGKSFGSKGFLFL